MDHLRAMRLFVRVAELGSLTAASTDLGYARGAASAIVAELERYLGVQLLERTTRRLRLTEDGARYLDRAGRPAHPDELAHHACLPRLPRDATPPPPWHFRINGAERTIAVRGPLMFDSVEPAIAAARHGAGILQLASYLVYDEIRSGRLVTILDEFRPAGLPVSIIHPRHRLKPRKLKVFEAFLMGLDREFRRRWNIRDTDGAASPASRTDDMDAVTPSE